MVLPWAPTAPLKHALVCQLLSIAKGPHDTSRMDRIVPKRRRGGRRKGEQRVAVLGTEDLYQLLGCSDVDSLLAKLKELGVGPYVSGYNDRRHVSVSDYELPEGMRERAREIAQASSGWVGK